MIQAGNFPSNHGHFLFSPKFWKFRLESKWNGPIFGSVLPAYLGPPLKVVHFDRYSHFGRSNRNVPFYLTKLLFLLAPLFCIMLTKNYNQTRGGLSRVSVTGMYRSIGRVEFPKLHTGMFVEWKALHACQASRRKNQARNRTAGNTLLMHTASNVYIKMAASGWPSSCNTEMKVTSAELSSPTNRASQAEMYCHAHFEKFSPNLQS